MGKLYLLYFKPFSRPVLARELVIGQDCDSIFLPHFLDKFGAVPLTVEDNHKSAQEGICRQLLLQWLPGDVDKQTGNDVIAQSRQQPLVDLPLDTRNLIAECEANETEDEVRDRFGWLLQRA